MASVRKPMISLSEISNARAVRVTPGCMQGFGNAAFLAGLGRGKAGTSPPLAIAVFLALGFIGMAIDGTNWLFLDRGGHNLFVAHDRQIKKQMGGTGT